MAGDISTYNAKRNFARTAEPPGTVARSGDKLRYLVQQHDASRMHYDFRLEVGGVLASWAVPKGPSLDPGEKRLAVRTEDHPISYGEFEGTIPKGEYGGGTVLMWDQGTWRPDGNAAEGLRKGALRFKLQGRRLRGSFLLTRLGRRPSDKTENWLLIKRDDEEAQPGSGDAVVRENTTSIKTRRGISEIAHGEPALPAKPAPAEVAEPPVLDKAKAKPIRKVDPKKLKGAKRSGLATKLSPQLATLVEVIPDEGEWISEIKFDGYRMVARLENGKVQLFSRNGLPWTAKLPEIAKALGRLPAKQAWLDGEVVAVEPEGRSSFSLLKQALSEKRTSGLVYYLFDILHLDGSDLAACRQDDRKRVLHGLLGPSPPSRLLYSDHVEGITDQIREQACSMRLEGIICKDTAAPYRQTRTKAWLKLKCVQREEFIILGFTDPEGSRIGFGALHLGYYDRDGNLRYAGGVGTGFNDRALGELRERLDRRTRRIGPRVLVQGEGPPKNLLWVTPDLVAEVQFVEWTGDAVVRHAVFLGLRNDKAAVDVIREPPPGTEGSARTVGGGAVVHATRPRARKKAAAKRMQVDVPAIIDARKSQAEGVRLSHPEKRLWPDDRLTKQHLAAYWDANAEAALPHLAGRPLALVRCPDGIKGETFFQKRASPGFPQEIDQLTIGKEPALAIHDAAGLQALAQMSAIEIHPWGSLIESVEMPDRLIFDLDPDEGLDFDRVISAAHLVRDVLKDAGLESFCKTTGGKGLHVVLPVRPVLAWPEAKAFCQALADTVARDRPREFTSVLAKKARSDRIFIDYLRNGRGSTAIGAFSPRARPGGTVASPLTWREVKSGLDPKRFTIATLADGPGSRAKAWDGFFDIDQRIGPKARKLFGLK